MAQENIDEFGREVCELSDRYGIPFVMVIVGEGELADYEIFSNVSEQDIDSMLKQAASGFKVDAGEGQLVQKIKSREDLN